MHAALDTHSITMKTVTGIPNDDEVVHNMGFDLRKRKLICKLDVKAERTSCNSGEMQVSDAELMFWSQDGGYIVSVGKGGVTGFENFGVNPNELHKIAEMNWIACCGTKGEWDRLFIPNSEMKMFYEKIILSLDRA